MRSRRSFPHWFIEFHYLPATSRLRLHTGPCSLFVGAERAIMVTKRTSRCTWRQMTPWQNVPEGNNRLDVIGYITWSGWGKSNRWWQTIDGSPDRSWMGWVWLRGREDDFRCAPIRDGREESIGNGSLATDTQLATMLQQWDFVREFTRSYVAVNHHLSSSNQRALIRSYPVQLPLSTAKTIKWPRCI